jgi:DNA-binding HxlR family transcriptional regulator
MKTFLNIKNSICPIRDILNSLGNKWPLLVLMTLNANGTMRFNDIHKSIGDISQRMLAVTLRYMEADGLLSRKAYPEVPPRVEYRLTALGKGLIPHIHNLVDWALLYGHEIVKTRGKSPLYQ